MMSLGLEIGAGHMVAGAWQLAWATHVGSRHQAAGGTCEDAVAHRLFPNQRLAVAVGDGVSGGAMGDLCADLAVRQCADMEPPTDAKTAASLLSDVAGLDPVVRDALNRHTQGAAGATTLAAAWLHPDGAGWLVHVGDVRAYLWAPGDKGDLGTLDLLTRDHTYLRLGQLPPTSDVPADNPARMLGIGGEYAAPTLQPLSLARGQSLLLCSDGLHGHVSAREMALHLQECQTKPETKRVAHHRQVAEKLVHQARRNRGDDDVTVMLLTRRP